MLAEMAQSATIPELKLKLRQTCTQYGGRRAERLVPSGHQGSVEAHSGGVRHLNPFAVISAI
jgi:hypothetical protein